MLKPVSGKFNLGPFSTGINVAVSEGRTDRFQGAFLVLSLWVMSTTFVVDETQISLAVATLPTAALLGLIFGTEYRVHVAIGTAPLLLGFQHYWRFEDVDLLFGIGGGPVGLFFANQIAYYIFGSGSGRRLWLRAGGKLDLVLPLASLGFVLYPAFPHVSYDGLRSGLDPRPFLVFLFFLRGYTLREHRAALILLASLFILSFFGSAFRSSGEPFESRMFDVFLHFTFADAGFVSSAVAGLLCGRVIRLRQVKGDVSWKNMWPIVVGLVALVAIDGLIIEAEFFLAGRASIYVNESLYLGPQGSWPPEYTDQILLESVASTVYAWSWSAFDIEDYGVHTGLGVGLCLLAIGYVFGLRGAIASSIAWISLYFFFRYVGSGGGLWEFISRPHYMHQSLLSYDGERGLLFVGRSGADSLLAPKVEFDNTGITLGPDFALAFLGSFLSSFLSLGRQKPSSPVSTRKFFYLFDQCPAPYLVMAIFGAIIMAYLLLRLAAVTIVGVWSAF